MSFNVQATEFVPSWLPKAENATSEDHGTGKVQSTGSTNSLADSVSEDVSKLSLAESADSTEVKESREVKDSKSAPLSKKAQAAQEDEDFEIPSEHKETLNMVFIGHVDAGKSTLGGQILFMTGVVDKRTMEKYERDAKEAGRESWYLSWAMDLNAEERAQGKTVECGRAAFETESRRYIVLDAPGHKTYVPSMIGGAQQADVAILVISARKGEFETGFEKGGQTREHAMLVKTAGVKKLVVVINKMDDPTVEWSQERYDECVNKLTPFLKSVGYNPKTDVVFMPVSGYCGANIKEPLDPKVCPWFKGPALLPYLDSVRIEGRNLGGGLIMPILDKYKDMGTVVSGKIEVGKVRKGQTVLIMPNKRQTQVSDIYIEDEEIPYATVGDNVRLRLKNVEEDELTAGFVVCSSVNPVHCVTAFEAQVKVVEYKSIMCAGYTGVLHVHSATEEVSLASMLHMLDLKTRKKSRQPPKFLRQGDVAIVRFETQSGQMICMETFDEVSQLGRFTIRDEGKTVMVGKVTKLL